MCRLLAWAAARPTPVVDALGRSEFEGFTALSRQHCDGWGMAWWPAANRSDLGPPLCGASTAHAERAIGTSAERGHSLGTDRAHGLGTDRARDPATDGAHGSRAETLVALPPAASPAPAPLVDRSVECAARDPRFHSLAATTTADAGFLHLRWATPGLAVTAANTHPFVHERMAFAHNGAIHPQNRLHELIPDGWEQHVTGTTDTERFFLAIAAQVVGGTPIEDAVADVVRRIFGAYSPTSLNATLLTPEALYTICAYDASRAPTLCDSSGGDNPSTAPDLTFYDLRYRVRQDSVVVASSGFDQPESDGWQPLSNMSLLRVERGTLATSVVSLIR